MPALNNVIKIINNYYLFVGKTTTLADDDLCLDITAVVPNTDSSSHVSRQVKQFLCMFTLIHRPRWITKYGQQYSSSLFLQYGWQDNDLPLFVKIFSIIVISEVILFNVEVYETQGINDHILGFLIKRTFHMKLINLMDCFSFETFCSHNYNGDNQLYICMHSHIEKN